MNTIDKTSDVLTQHQRLDIGHCLCGWGVDTGQLGRSHSKHVAEILQRAGLLPDDDARAEVTFFKNWSNDLADLIPEDDAPRYSNPEAAQEAIILDCLAAYLGQLREVGNLHRSWDIYDECGHRHELNEDGSLPDDVKNIPEVGYVCHEGFMYSICRECCTDGEFQTEECATYHNHHQPGPRCRTNAILEGDS